ncbi:TIGR03936 family radical SAM-associated protein [Lipingzhangella sp. LS1_29]|uniref:TIGR03936 family radical SAM-associated protein n=1 Tax=Lipingzhangella rawalii TaxID=2055835 RepID=A0ABU2H738_9ACTN|nr:TIGR03936 family radical SAM-associated protein [Lipingzhangella rawalii]MDS1271122.1 TIGR03936 family radical SAM-associated protein [Lipingzhangella rawalii]
MRFASHRDIARTVERALRRARVPVAYSAGFSPHPKISYPGAAPTGVASEAEYLEILVTEPYPAESFRQELDAAMPEGLDVLAVEADPDDGLSDRLEGSAWQIELPGVSSESAGRAVAAFLTESAVEVERVTKKGRRRFDTRGAVLALRVCQHSGPDPEYATIQLVVRHTTPTVRPDDVVTALRQVADLAPPAPARVTRLAQGPLAEVGRLVDGGAVATDAAQAEALASSRPQAPSTPTQPAQAATQSRPTAERPE